MRRIYLLLIALLGSFTAIQGQPQVSLSEPFKEPGGGMNKILQMSNGTTFRFRLGDDMEVHLYDKAHKQVAKQMIKGKPWLFKELYETTVNGVYEINGEPVIFVTQYTDRSHILYRIRFDDSTGKPVEEKIVDRTERYPKGAGYAIAFGDLGPNGFFVEKDPLSDHYAVTRYTTTAHETAQRIKVTHYSGNHTELSQAYLGIPGNFKYTKYIAMAVTGKYVITTTYGYNTASSGGKDSRIIVSRLRPGEKDFSHELLEFSDDFKKTTGIMEYNPATGKIQLLTNTFIKGKSKFNGTTTNYYMPILSSIDPESLSLSNMKTLAFAKATEYAKNQRMPNEFRGMPQNMFINNRNNVVVVTEATKVSTYAGALSSKTDVEETGIIEYDAEGNEIQGTVVPKAQYADDLIDIFYQNKKLKGMWGASLGSENQVMTNWFYSSDVICTDKGCYVLFNDLPENLQKPPSEKMKMFSPIHETNLVYHRIGKDPEKKFLFGQPDEDSNTFCYIASSHYLKSANSYATIIVERNGREKKSYVAWLNFE